MKEEMINKALKICSRGKITPDELGNINCPSSDGSKTYIISRSNHCNCAAIKSICCHLLSTVYVDALLSIQLMRYADSPDFLQAVVDQYSTSVEAMPDSIRERVKAEYKLAKERLMPVDLAA